MIPEGLFGFVWERMRTRRQAAFPSEAGRLVAEEVVTGQELDGLVTSSTGPRWAVAGSGQSFRPGGDSGRLITSSRTSPPAREETRPVTRAGDRRGHLRRHRLQRADHRCGGHGHRQRRQAPHRHLPRGVRAGRPHPGSRHAQRLPGSATTWRTPWHDPAADRGRAGGGNGRDHRDAGPGPAVRTAGETAAGDPAAGVRDAALPAAGRAGGREAAGRHRRLRSRGRRGRLPRVPPNSASTCGCGESRWCSR